MSKNPKEFPAVADKLSAPTKKSIFERQKAEAEAKRLKEEEETAAVYADFVKSFDDAGGPDDDEGHGGVFTRGPARSSTGLGRPPAPSGPGKRHFTTNLGGTSGKPGFGGGPRASGPGSLGPAPGLSRKRTFDGAPARGSGQRSGRAGFEPLEDETKPAFGDSDDDDTKDVKAKEAERAASKPTLRLTSLPPLLGPSVIKALFPSELKVESVQILPSSETAGNGRKSASAIVTLALDTPASEIDSAVSALSNRYLGWGFYLNLSRHLSSTAVGSTVSLPNLSTSSTLPFGAKTAHQGPSSSLSRAPPPPGLNRGFAPPASYGPSARSGPAVQVEVKPPSDLKQLKLIHKTVENVISHGPEFEALLMSRPSVQRDEKWAWLWDARSQGGVWYRWRLWDILTSAQQRIRKGNGKNDNSTQIVFLGGAPWASQERALPFEYESNIAEFVSDSEYDSSEDEDSGDEGRRRLDHLQGGSSLANPVESELPNYLNPLQKAKLVHLLARLPTSTARLRRGDIARVTAFAIKYASEGADEVVGLIVSNVRQPFVLSSANPERKADLARESAGNSDEDQPGTGVGLSRVPTDKDRDKDIDLSSTKLVALYAISDILSSSSTSGVRHAWRYRQLFETVLRKQNVFAHLGRLEKELGWGRLRAEKFKRSVNGLLALWEGWCVFPAAAQEEFGTMFNEPPVTEKEKAEAAKKEVEEEKAKKAVGSKWRTVEESEKAEARKEDGLGDENIDAVDGEPMVEDDEDIDGVPMDEDDEDLDGEPMDEDGDDGEAPGPEKVEMDSTQGPKAISNASPGSRPEAAPSKPAEPMGTGTAPAKKRRPRAEDMFADSDGE